MSKSPQFFDYHIPAGASVGAAVDMGNKDLVGIIVPAGWTAANITFDAADPRGTNGYLNTVAPANGNTPTFYEVVDDSGAEVVVTVAASRYVSVKQPDLMNGVRYLKVRSGTHGVPVNQTAAVDLVLITREV